MANSSIHWVSGPHHGVQQDVHMHQGRSTPARKTPSRVMKEGHEDEQQNMQINVPQDKDKPGTGAAISPIYHFSWDVSRFWIGKYVNTILAQQKPAKLLL